MTSIGWYVHHHGHGHLARFLSIRPHLDADVTCFSSLPAPAWLPARTTWILLDRDDQPEPDSVGTTRLPAESDPTASGAFHWAPLQHEGHRRRLAAIAAVVTTSRFDAFVVDVSIEVTLFVRLLGLPVIVVAQPGDRGDRPHRAAYRAATRILAPWPRDLLPAPHLEEASDVVHTGGISRFEGRVADRHEPGRRILVLQARGGSDIDRADIDAARSATPSYEWTVLGLDGRWVDDPWEDLVRADVVVSWAGQNSIADLATADAKAIVIPQQRPFDEHVTMARALSKADLALSEPRWPSADRWGALLERAGSQRPGWERWKTDGAARRAAEAIVEVAIRWAA